MKQLVSFTKMGWNGKLMMCTLNIMKKMPVILCFYMENILTAATLFFFFFLTIPFVLYPIFSNRGWVKSSKISAWSDRKEMQFSSKRIHNKKWHLHVCYCNADFCAHTLWNKVSKLTESWKCCIISNEKLRCWCIFWTPHMNVQCYDKLFWGI